MSAFHPDHPPSESVPFEPEPLLDTTGLLSAEPVENVSVEVGSTIVLPCKLESVGPETLYIKWIKESNMVFERKPDNGKAGEGYEGRVDVPEEELRKGNCSLVLRNPTLNDTGVYTNIQLVPRIKRSVTREFKKISSVSLSVSGPIPNRFQPALDCLDPIGVGFCSGVWASLMPRSLVKMAGEEAARVQVAISSALLGQYGAYP
ncbi:hypothetical protein C0J50_8734 [Silurus asotus]|uniref:Ig-like domain-containing protein n=1 Tax=Silurus asotus TaxID=30991 RepID=A0AAD5AGY9_SILAS|nr:hypothetical protein C0J50_8734 [Silurus asotus]